MSGGVDRQDGGAAVGEDGPLPAPEDSPPGTGLTTADPSPPVGALSDPVRPVVEPTPEAAGMAVRQERRMMAVSASYEGPLPPPKYVAGYEEVLPGAAERLFKQIEVEQKHRHKLEMLEANRRRDASQTQNTVALRAQPFAFGAFSIAAASGVGLAFAGMPGPGAAAILGAIGLGAATFLSKGRVRWKGLTSPSKRDGATADGAEEEDAG